MAEEVGDRSAAVEVPSCGESGTLQVAGQGTPQGGGGGGAAKGLAHLSGDPERKRSRLGWAQ